MWNIVLLFKKYINTFMLIVSMSQSDPISVSALGRGLGAQMWPLHEILTKLVYTVGDPTQPLLYKRSHLQKQNWTKSSGHFEQLQSGLEMHEQYSCLYFCREDFAFY